MTTEADYCTCVCHQPGKVILHDRACCDSERRVLRYVDDVITHAKLNRVCLSCLSTLPDSNTTQFCDDECQREHDRKGFG